MCKVSIIMPVYNKGLYLKRTLEAILSQSYMDWELILINDGSTDCSQEIAQSYVELDKRIQLINQSNMGVSVARNRGLSLASGEWVWFVDADDVPNTDFLRYSFSNNVDEVSIVVGSFERIHPDGYVEPITISEIGVVGQDRFPKIFMKYQYENGYWGYLWNKLIRRQMISDLDVSFEVGLTLAEDLRFMVELYGASPKLLLVPTSAMRYMMETCYSSKEKKINYAEQMKTQLMIYSWIVKCQEQAEYEAELRCVVSRYAAYIVFYAFEDGENYRERAHDLMDNPFVHSLLCVDGVGKVMAPIVRALIKHDVGKISMYLRLRSVMRKWVKSWHLSYITI